MTAETAQMKTSESPAKAGFFVLKINSPADRFSPFSSLSILFQTRLGESARSRLFASSMPNFIRSC